MSELIIKKCFSTLTIQLFTSLFLTHLLSCCPVVLLSRRTMILQSLCESTRFVSAFLVHAVHCVAPPIFITFSPGDVNGVCGSLASQRLLCARCPWRSLAGTSEAAQTLDRRQQNSNESPRGSLSVLCVLEPLQRFEGSFSFSLSPQGV